MTLTETLIQSTTLIQNDFLNINRDQIRLPNGAEHSRIVVRHPGAACVLAITDDARVVLVRQWRHAVGRALLEVPAGKLDKNENPESCALRELSEETPYTAQHIEKLSEFYTAPGFCDEIMYLYRATKIRADSTLSPDTDELTQTELFTQDQARQAIANGEICDAKTLIALQFWFNESLQAA